MEPRIYLYKITFKGRPEWYWGIHKEKKFNEYYMGSPHTHKDFWIKYQPQREILELFDYSQEGWSQARCKEIELILPHLNDPLCLNEGCGGIFSLEAARLSALRGSTPERKEKASKLLTELCLLRWKDPSYQEFHSNKMKTQWKDPTFLIASEVNPRGTGTMWITNGTKEGSIKIKRGSEIPAGYRPGRVCK
jgi:hypothetical protein